VRNLLEKEGVLSELINMIQSDTISKCCLVWMMAMLTMISTGCIFQNGSDYVSGGTILDLRANTLIGTDEHLYVLTGKAVCLDWEGTTIWESQKLGGWGMVFLGDGFFAKTYDQSSKKGGVAFLNLNGEILWQEETRLISTIAIDASQNLLAAGTRDGVLWVFSKAGDVLWTYTNYVEIDQVVVALDSSCVIFTDYHRYLTCVREGEVVWSKTVKGIYEGGSNRIMVCSPDSSYFVYRSEEGGSKMVASTLEGKEIWSVPLESELRSVAVTSDGTAIIAGCRGAVYKFTSAGILVWKIDVGADNQYIAITPEADYIAVGSASPFSHLILLSGEGEVLWKARSSDNIFAVGISPNGKYVVFSNRLGKLYIYSNPPETSETESSYYYTARIQ